MNEEQKLAELDAIATELTATLADLESRRRGVQVRFDEEIASKDIEAATHRETLAALRSDLRAMAAATTEAGRRVEAMETEMAPIREHVRKLEEHLANPGAVYGTYGTETAAENKEG